MSIFDHLLKRDLAHVKRFNNRPVHFPESVAEHSFYVSYFTQILCWALGEEKIEVNTERAVKMALIHDQEEGFSGDILTPFKYFNEEVAAAIREVNNQTIEMMFEDLDEKLKKDFVALWHEEQSRKSLESQVVKVADGLSLISKCFEEIEAGNSYFEEIYKRILKDLKNLDYSWWQKIRPRVLSGTEKEV
ncbi:MAG: HD domain-containing protein [bacterium]|nr:HD domain-containing protein [bacterium]